MAALVFQSPELTNEHLGWKNETPPSSPPKIFTETARRSLRNLSTQALLANRRAEETLQQYAIVQQSSKGGRGGATDLAGFPDWASCVQSSSSKSAPSATLHGTSKDREQSFNDDALAVDVLIKSLASNLRLDSMQNQKSREAEHVAKYREEQRRARAVEERIARQREAEARDPHKKVSMKIENTRKYNMEAVHEMGIPMTQVQFTGNSGVECVDMVDCLKIRQRCKQIDTGATPSVRALVQEQARQDRMCSGISKISKGKSVSTGDLHFRQTTGCMSSYSPSVGAGRRQKGVHVGRSSTPSLNRGLCDLAERSSSTSRRAAWQESVSVP